MGCNNQKSCLTPFASIYEIPVTDIDGKPVSLEEYKGKVLIIINVASK